MTHRLTALCMLRLLSWMASFMLLPTMPSLQAALAWKFAASRASFTSCCGVQGIQTSSISKIVSGSAHGLLHEKQHCIEERFVGCNGGGEELLFQQGMLHIPLLR